MTMQDRLVFGVGAAVVALVITLLEWRDHWRIPKAGA